MADKQTDETTTNEETTNADTASTSGEAKAGAAPQFDAAEVEALRAQAAELAKIKAEKAAAEQAEAVKRGEHEKVIATLKAEAEAVKATAARQAEDLALVGLHAGLSSEEARVAARAAFGLIPEGKRTTLADAVKGWIKEPDRAPLMVRAYIQPANTHTAPTGSSVKGKNAGASSEAVLRWARQTGRVTQHTTPNEYTIQALAKIYAKHHKAE